MNERTSALAADVALPRRAATRRAHRSGKVALWVLVLVALCGWGVIGSLPDARAQAAADVTQLPALVRGWVNQNLAHQASRFDPPLRLQATVGTPDSRLRLAPCGQTEVFLPPGARLWGTTRVGVRCLVGATHWSVTLPVTVQALGAGWVLRRDVPAGALLTAADFVQDEVDFAADVSPVLGVGTAAWEGQLAARPLTAGQPLRQNMVRAVQVFQAGTSVRVLVQGGGFQISAQGEAMAAGIVGQNIRVRTESGRVLTVKVLDARTVVAEI
jgi:flagella basal body P-ring formation protein FlgA